MDRSKAPLSIVLFSFQDRNVGDNKNAQEFLRSLQKNTRETDIKGWLENDVLGLILPDTDGRGVQKYIEKIKNGNGGVAFSAVTGTYPDDLFNKLLAAATSQIDLFPLNLDEFRESKSFQQILKNFMDVVGSIFGILLFSPLMLMVTIAVKVTSSGPIIFKQVRLGKNGSHFSFYKFRSMYCDVDDQIHREYVTNLIKGQNEKINRGKEEKPFWDKMKRDPRVTPLGKIIRKTSIDELPQFFNVLKGEMSLVGPRPALPYEVEKYEPWHLRRILEVKPGITGLWQVDGKGKTSFDDMVRMDLRYVQTWSLWLEFKILLKTIRAVVRPNGAV